MGSRALLFARLRRAASLLADPRTPKLPRLAALLAVVYLLWPVDLVPDWVFPVVGYLDDLAFLWLAVRWLLRSGAKEPGEASGGAQGSRGARD